MYRKNRRKKHKIWPLLFLLSVALLCGIIYYILSVYTVKNVYVDGNVHYTNEEISDIVMAGKLGNNSLYLSIKYKNKGITDVPFLDAIDVNIVSPDTIRITVYEKALAGYVEYLGRYMYFDKDGTVVESSNIKTKGIPQISGLSFDYVVLAKQLPVEDESIFNQILNYTQLLTKYNLAADKIYFAPDGQVSVSFGNVLAALGKGENVDRKIMLLPSLLPDLEGKSGTLRMENYSESNTNITFEPDVDTNN